MADAEWSRRAERARSDEAIADLLSTASSYGLISNDGGESNEPAIRMRVDPPVPDDSAEAYPDCAARMPVCRAVCCKLAVRLSAEEVEADRVRWDPSRPFLLLREEDGRCTHQQRDTLACDAYADRPKPCRRYSCVSDRRIWRDFENWVLNTEWLEGHLPPDRPQLIQLQPISGKA